MATMALRQVARPIAAGTLSRCPGLAQVLLRGNSNSARLFMERRDSLSQMEGRDRFVMSKSRSKHFSIIEDLGPGDPSQAQICREVRFLGRDRRVDEALALASTVAEPDLHLQVAVLTVLTQAFDLQRAWQKFEELPRKPKVAYNMMINMLARNRQLDEALRLYDEMKASGVEPNAITHNSIVSAYGMMGDAAGAERQFAEIEASGCELTEVEFGSLMGAYGKSGDRPRAVKLLEKMDAMRVEPHKGHFTSMVMTCSRSREFEPAKGFFDEMRRRGCVPDVVAYTALLGCVAGPEASKIADEMLKQMQSEGIQPHTFFYNEMLRCATESLDDDCFRKLLREMDDKGLRRNSITDTRIRWHQRALDNAAAERRWQQQAESAPPVEAPLPAGWLETTDPTSGQKYYWKEADPANTVTWTRPV